MNSTKILFAALAALAVLGVFNAVDAATTASADSEITAGISSTIAISASGAVAWNLIPSATVENTKTIDVGVDANSPSTAWKLTSYASAVKLHSATASDDLDSNLQISTTLLTKKDVSILSGTQDTLYDHSTPSAGSVTTTATLHQMVSFTDPTANDYKDTLHFTASYYP